ncbi:MAG: hypothetical protein ACRELA_11965 [Candidatus Rokuibacteriota bacterium]
MSLVARVAGVLVAGALVTAAVGTWAGPDSGPGGKISTVRGVVKSLTAKRLSLETAQPDKAAEMVFVVDEKTVVVKRGKTIAVKEVRAGDAVTVAYAANGSQAVAKRVWVRTDENGSRAAPKKP